MLSEWSKVSKPSSPSSTNSLMIRSEVLYSISASIFMSPSERSQAYKTKSPLLVHQRRLVDLTRLTSVSSHPV